MFQKIAKVVFISAFLMGVTACGVANDNKNVAFDRTNDTNQTLDDNRGTVGQNRTTDVNMRRVTNKTGMDIKRRARQVDPNISADFTSMSSENYPHTKAVLVRDAQYAYTKIGPNEINDFQDQFGQQFDELTPQLGEQALPPTAQQPQGQMQNPGQNNRLQMPQAQPQTPAPNNNQKPVQQQPKQPANKQGTTNNGASISRFAQQVITLTNQERAKQGLPALTADAKLSSVAQKKAEDMQAKHYFSHTSPTYGSPFDMMRDFGVTYKSAGENIAQGQRTPQEVVQAWMNSEGHRKNIMSRDFTHIGVGFEQAGNHWSQMFIGK